MLLERARKFVEQVTGIGRATAGEIAALVRFGGRAGVRCASRPVTS